MRTDILVLNMKIIPSHQRIPRWKSHLCKCLPPLGNLEKPTGHGLLKHHKVTSLWNFMWTMRMRTHHLKPSIARIELYPTTALFPYAVRPKNAVAHYSTTGREAILITEIHP